MVVIRLARGGSKKRPFYSVVVTDKRNRRDSNFVERLGYYNPRAVATEQAFRIAQDPLTYWSGVGAEMSPTVKRLIKQHSTH
jgi:small subunit ribosomal protein S16